MKTNAVILKIDSPCTQDRSSMVPTSTGNYCLHCAKNVIDFSALTDDQILQTLSQSTGKLCGRFNHQQLNRVIEQKKRSSTNLIPGKFLAGMTLLMGVSNLSAAGNDPQKKQDPFPAQQSPVGKQEKDVEAEPVTDTLVKFFTGRLVDAFTGEPIIFAPVRLQGTVTDTTTDIEGRFALAIPASQLRDTMVFEIRYVGYGTKQLTIGKDQLKSVPGNTFAIITMQPEERMLEGEIIVVKKKKKWWQFRR